jgi:hypothetical protein
MAALGRAREMACFFQRHEGVQQPGRDIPCHRAPPIDRKNRLIHPK